MAHQTFSIPTHPYYPQDAYIPDYVPNTSSLVELMIQFGSLLAITIFTALWFATKLNPRLTLVDKFVLGWFTLCKYIFFFLLPVLPLKSWYFTDPSPGGSLHCFFEGTYLEAYVNKQPKKKSMATKPP